MGALLLIAGTALAPAAVLAAPFFDVATGDWLDGASWSGGAVPGPADSPVIDNGGTATAADTSIQTGSLAVGSRLDAARPTDAGGRLELTGVDVALGGDLAIGVVDVADQSASVSGALVGIAGGSLPTPGNVVSGGTSRIGVIGSNGAAGSTAQGTLSLDGTLETAATLEVGVARQPGIAQGSVDVSDISLTPIGSPLVDVGTASAGFSPAPSSVTGDLSADSVTVDFGSSPGGAYFRVGSAHSEGEAVGTADVGLLSGFAMVQAGVASTGSGIVSDAEGTIFAGKVLANEAPSFQPMLWVGASFYDGGTPGVATARGTVEFGEIDERYALIGYTESGPAYGSVVVGGGGPLSGSVGETNSNGDAVGRLVTGGDLGSVRVGYSYGGGGTSGLPFVTGDATGTVVADGHATGAIVGWSISDGTATGSMDVSAILSPTGALSGANGVAVGLQYQAAGVAQGVLRVGDRTGAPPTPGSPVLQTRLIEVGVQQVFADGTATGYLESHGDVESRSFNPTGDRVGYGNATSSGHAEGWWSLHDGTYTGNRLTVGLTEGTGTATGRIDLHRMRVDLGGLTLGAGATVRFDVEHLLAYSVIDAAAAVLDGALEVDFTGPAQLGVYDLIVSGAPDGLTGDFASVAISGLAPGQNALYGVTTADVGGSEVAVYRVRIVPEPGTALLLALGLAGLARCARVRR